MHCQMRRGPHRLGVTPENVALFSLIDVLRSIGEAVDAERVRLAAILVRKPVLAAAFMDDAQAKQWCDSSARMRVL